MGPPPASHLRAFEAQRIPDFSAVHRQQQTMTAADQDHIGRREAAEILEVHVDTVSKMLREGLEVAVVHRAGKKGALVLSRRAVEAWDAARRAPDGLDPRQERARRDRAAADLAELKLRVQRGELLEVADVEATWSAHIAAVRPKLLAWPATLTDRLYRAARQGAGAVELELDRAVREVLEELAAGDLEAPRPSDEATRARCGAQTVRGGACRNRAGEAGRCHLHQHIAAEAAGRESRR